MVVAVAVTVALTVAVAVTVAALAFNHGPSQWRGSSSFK